MIGSEQVNLPFISNLHCGFTAVMVSSEVNFLVDVFRIKKMLRKRLLKRKIICPSFFLFFFFFGGGGVEQFATIQRGSVESCII